MDSMLGRYKKPGGFLQLLSLLESFGPQKREKFMNLIEDEDISWARALKSKMLTIERLFTWPEDVISEVFRRLPIKNLACVLKNGKAADVEKIVKFMTHAERRKLDDEMAAMSPKPEEVFATYVKVIELTRKMIKEGEIRIEKFEPNLIIPEGYEMNLMNDMGADEPTVKTTWTQMEAAQAPQAAHAPQAHDTHHAHHPDQADVVALQRTIAVLTKENRALKDELHAIRSRLDQIKKIA